MGTMANGKWVTDADIATAKDGAWQRTPSVLCGIVKPTGSKDDYVAKTG
jgi:glutathionyl-hydroquinone reductase